MSTLSETAERNREVAIGRLKILMPGLFAIGFLFYVAITVFPLAGMPGPPLQPFGPGGSFLQWLAIACASGGLLALLGALVIAATASSEDEA